MTGIGNRLRFVEPPADSAEESGNPADGSISSMEKLENVSWAQILSAGREFLKTAGIAEYDLDAWYLFSAAFHMDKARYYLDAGRQAQITKDQLKQYQEQLRRRAARTPLQHILGTQDFMGITFAVNEHVLIPRQDTEILVETVLKENSEQKLSVLDMCTGSGCIAISLKALGAYEQVEGADISEPALAMAKRNAGEILAGEAGKQRLTASGRETGREDGLMADNTVNFRLSDLFSAFGPGDRYDLIVSNPPYIPSNVIEGLEPEVRDFEPRNALDGTEDGLYFYRRLAEESPSFLKEGGKVYFEIGYDQGQSVSNLLAAGGFTEIRVIKDLAGKDRVVCAKKAGAAGCRCLKQEV